MLPGRNCWLPPPRGMRYLRLTAEVASSYINVRTWEEKCLIIRRVHASYEQALRHV